MAAPHHLSARHALLALAAVAVWGSNFVVIRIGLDQLPPLLFAALRFAFALLPAAFFIRRPSVAWRSLAAYGVLIGAGQFGLLYIAMQGRISPGLASLVIQMQVFFTIGLSVALSGERVLRVQWLALLLSAVGIGVIAAHASGGTTPLGLGLVLGAAFCWACGNMIARVNTGANMLGYVVWASLFSVPPLFVLSLLFDGWPAIVGSLHHASWITWGAVLWQSIGNTLFGYAVWGFLLARYPAALVSPLALLVPVVGMSTSALVLGEPMPGWKLGGGAGDRRARAGRGGAAVHRRHAPHGHPSSRNHARNTEVSHQVCRRSPGVVSAASRRLQPPRSAELQRRQVMPRGGGQQLRPSQQRRDMRAQQGHEHGGAAAQRGGGARRPGRGRADRVAGVLAIQHHRRLVAQHRAAGRAHHQVAPPVMQRAGWRRAAVPPAARPRGSAGWCSRSRCSASRTAEIPPAWRSGSDRPMRRKAASAST